MTYHYTESGLDNVYLLDGYTIHETPFGKGVSIQNTEGLHKAIGKWLIAQPRRLNGAELRFIRTQMELTQRALAGIIGAEEQTLRLWEKNRDKFMPATAERLLRALYSEALGNNVHIKRMLEARKFIDRRPRLRALYSEALGNNVQIKRMLEARKFIDRRPRLADLDRVEGGKACFTKKNGWKPLNAPDLEPAHG